VTKAAPKKTRAPRKLNVAVIGAGGIARSVHLPSLADIPSVNVVAICDLVEEKARTLAEKYSIPRVYTLYRKMLDAESLDAVFVLVEPSNMFHPAHYCVASAKLPTFIEKPPGVTSDQARALARAADASGQILQVGFNRRHIPLVQHVVKLMRKLTTVNQVEGRFMKLGSAAFDLGGISSLPSDVIHAIDLMRDFAGGTPVKAATREPQTDDIVPNAWNAVIRFDNNVTGVLKSNYNTGGRSHTFEIHGHAASAFINLGLGGAQCEACVIAAQGKGGYSLASTGVAPNQPLFIDGKALAGSDKFYRYYGFYQEDLHFLDCVRKRRQPITSIHDAVKTFEMVDLISSSLI